jgi:hypothetical protein
MILFLISVVSLGCSESNNTTYKESTDIEVSVLIHENSESFIWFRDVKIEKGINAYDLTEIVVDGDLESTYYASMFSHLVQSIMGKANKDPNYWIIFLWDHTQRKWIPLPVGADLFSLKNGHVIGWVYTEYGKEIVGLPSPGSEY